MRVLFIGGPGRSGTSFVAQRLGRHPQICTFDDIELKLFTEKSGLLDLHHSLVSEYSPNRASVALAQFQRMTASLIDGQFGQPALSGLLPRENWQQIFDRFCKSVAPDGHAVRHSDGDFYAAAGQLLSDLVAAAAGLTKPARRPALFLEKTPHALLSIGFLERLAPGAAYLHVMRDPRAIAFSLRRMRWGPDRLKTCCTWVASYCEAWLDAQLKALKHGLSVEKFRIEDVAATPTAHANQLCRRLAIEPVDTLFDGASLKVLHGWREECSADETELLEERLGGWAWEFGYRDAAAAGADSCSEPIMADGQ